MCHLGRDDFHYFFVVQSDSWKLVAYELPNFTSSHNIFFFLFIYGRFLRQTILIFILVPWILNLKKIYIFINSIIDINLGNPLVIKCIPFMPLFPLLWIFTQHIHNIPIPFSIVQSTCVSSRIYCGFPFKVSNPLKIIMKPN